jgi:hypothetical protein
VKVRVRGEDDEARRGALGGQRKWKNGRKRLTMMMTRRRQRWWRRVENGKLMAGIVEVGER